MATNGIYIVLGEANTVVALLNKARRQFQVSQQPPSLEDTDPLLRNFADLKDVLNTVADLGDMNPLTYLSPFLDVIKAQNTNGPITEAALASVGKFLSYGLIDASSIKAGKAVGAIATAVVQTKFIGGKSTGSDECVLYKILHVLRSLLLSPPGSLLSNEAVCEMMQSSFRIAFEGDLSPLLRKAAEATLSDMTQLIFTRLPTFHEDVRHPYYRKLVMNAKGDKKKRRRRATAEPTADDTDVEEDLEVLSDAPVNLASQEIMNEPTTSVESNATSLTSQYDVVTSPSDTGDIANQDDNTGDADSESDGDQAAKSDAVTPVKSTALSKSKKSDDESTDFDLTEMPYGLPCCTELLRFLISIANPVDRQNTESMVLLGLNLITVAFEAAADHLSSYSFLMTYIKDNLCRALLKLLETQKLPVLAATNRVCFLLFESMRSHLKFQLESYLHELKSIVLNEQNSSERKEMALESIVQLWRIPGLVTELYLNYDCDLYCSNIFEELAKLLADMSFPVSGLRPSSLLSLDALLVVIDTIDKNCICRQAGGSIPDNDPRSAQLDLPILSGYDLGKKILNGDQATPEKIMGNESITTVVLRSNRHAPSEKMPSMTDVLEQKDRKRIIAEATDKFNQNPKDGINFLRTKGLLGSEPESVVNWLRSDPHLDKKKIADYICSRKNADVLQAFVKSLPFENTRLDEALRIFLETFRLPGEAAEISMVMQHFSDQWYKANNEPFNHVDAAFTLSYGIILLNTDQHNPQVKRNQPPMTVDCFKRNLSGTNGSKDFEPKMLEEIYYAIKSDEIVMPAEQKGLVKENYLWKVLLRRGESTEGLFVHAPTGWNDYALFSLVWGPAIAALSYMFDKSEHDIILKRALNGYRMCASIASHFGMKDVFDNLIIHLCKFSSLSSRNEGTEEHLEVRKRSTLDHLPQNSPEIIAISYGTNKKAQEATRVIFELVHQHGDILKEGWRNVLDVLLHLFYSRLLPSELTEVDDFVSEKGWVSIIRAHYKSREVVSSRNESGLLSWFGLGGSAAESEKKKPSNDEVNAMKLAQAIISDCKPSQIVTDSKYLTSAALSELLSSLVHSSRSVVESSDEQKQGVLSEEDEDALVFYLELIVSVSLENKDRLTVIWPTVYRHLEWLLSSRFGRCPVLVERSVVGLLRLANRNLFRDNTVSDEVLQSLSLLLKLSPRAMFVFSRQIAYGLHELLHNNAANLHKKEHWNILFALMEASGAALLPEDVTSDHSPESERKAYSDFEYGNNRSTFEDRGYTSDVPRLPKDNQVVDTGGSSQSLSQSRDWIYLDHGDAARASQDALRALGSDKPSLGRGSLVLCPNLGRHEPASFIKIADCLAFLLRDAVHVTPDNLESSIHCLRAMVEAGLDGGRYAGAPLSGEAQNFLKPNAPGSIHKAKSHGTRSEKKELTTDVVEDDETNKDENQLSSSYQQVSLQLLDLCTTVHSLAPGILTQWSTSNAMVDASLRSLWTQVWKPLLQAVARLGCDCRRAVRASALNHLQRLFMPAIMGNLGAEEWESCFSEVLFPLLTKLLEPFSPMDIIGMEDTRVRAMQIVSKTLLNHLSALSSLPSFPALWLRLLDFMERYFRIDSCGNLNEVVPESFKNMLLVLDNTGLFSTIPGLYEITTTKMSSVLPQLIRDIIPNPPAVLPTPNPAVLQQQINNSLGNVPSMLSRVQLAPAAPTAYQETIPTTITTGVAVPPPVEIVELTEVVVHSGATSPRAGSPPSNPTATEARMPVGANNS
ncbi:unnamed protein product [Auanema sp. JU1783]|nr:unnamed protein product [Auanema sp. JU1783]